MDPSTQDPNIRKLWNVVEEIVESETTFSKYLAQMVFMEQMFDMHVQNPNSSISQADSNLLFRYIAQLNDIHGQIGNDFDKLMRQERVAAGATAAQSRYISVDDSKSVRRDSVTSPLSSGYTAPPKAVVERVRDRIAEIYETRLPWMRPWYEKYVTGYEQAASHLHKLQKTAAFGKWWDQVNSALDHSLSLESFLVMPIQRLPRYCLLLEQLLKFSADDSDVETLRKALSAARDTANLINEAKRAAERQDKMEALVKQLPPAVIGFDLVRPDRHLVREGKLNKEASKAFPNGKKAHFYAFNDLFLWVSDKKKGPLGFGSDVEFEGAFLWNYMIVEEHMDAPVFTLTAPPSMERDDGSTPGLLATFSAASQDEAKGWVTTITELVDLANMEDDARREAEHKYQENLLDQQIQAEEEARTSQASERMLGHFMDIKSQLLVALVALKESPPSAADAQVSKVLMIRTVVHLQTKISDHDTFEGLPGYTDGGVAGIVKKFPFLRDLEEALCSYSFLRDMLDDEGALPRSRS